MQQQRPTYITGRRAMSPTGAPAGSPIPGYYSPASPAAYLRPSSLGHYAAMTSQLPGYGSFPTHSPYTPPRSMPGPSASSSSSHSSALGGSIGINEQLSQTNLYIRGLTPNTTDSDLERLCEHYGTIVSTKAIIDQTTSKCKGYGFVDFELPTSAEQAVVALQKQGVQAQMAKQQEQDPTNLYIANLPPFMSENDLEATFKQYGNVISTRILRDNNGLSRGVGFCRMESKEKCDKIISIFNGRPIHAGAKEPLTVKFADGGNKKKTPPKQWIDRSPSEIGAWSSALAYDPSGAHNGMVSPFSAAPTVMTPPQIPQYAASALRHSYALPSSWLPHAAAQQYAMIQQQPQLHLDTYTNLLLKSREEAELYQAMQMGMHAGTPGLDPAMPLASQMNQLQLSGASYVTGPHGTYPQLAYPQTTLMQAIPQVEEATAVTGPVVVAHYVYTQAAAAAK